jgi:hypothetical protein
MSIVYFMCHTIYNTIKYQWRQYSFDFLNYRHACFISLFFFCNFTFVPI